MRLIFVGAVEGSYYSLERLLKGGANILRIYTLGQKHSVRHSDFKDLTPLSAQFNVPISYINNINEPEVIKSIQDLKPDYILILGWSQLVKQILLEIPSRGVIGFHPAVLPINRGRAALPWVILRREQTAGASLFFIDEGMDSGDIICQREFNVSPTETARTLYDKIIQAQLDMISEILPALKNGSLKGVPQNHSRATYTAKRVKNDGFIDWKQSADDIWTLIRAVSEPYPGAFTFYKGKRLIIWSVDFLASANYVGVPGQILRREEEGGVLVQCGTGYVLLRTVQEEGDEKIAAEKYFTRVHDILGIDWLDILSSLQQLR